MLLARSNIKTGEGLAVVVAVGENTYAGDLGSAGSDEDETTPLQDRLEDLAGQLGNFGWYCALVIFFFYMLRLGLELGGVIPCGCQNIVSCTPIPDCVPLSFDFDENNRLWTELLEAVIVAIAVVVMAIPEGLPLAVVISLSIASKKMLKL